jgi:hypothetical protein
VAFVGSWTPYAGMALYISITKDNRVNLICVAIVLILAKSTPIWNPYIYFLRDKQFNFECQELIPFLSRHGFWRIRSRNQEEDVTYPSPVIPESAVTNV